VKYVPAIDGLRAIAVLAVVAYHAGLPVPAGFVGVDVFFVISGYLITGLLAREHRETGRIDFMAFYARRARRILPALVAVVLVTLGLSALLLGYVGEVAASAAAA
jgi:peptidoglycan/LPS O-acetylase OafA/YrhL